MIGTWTVKIVCISAGLAYLSLGLALAQSHDTANTADSPGPDPANQPNQDEPLKRYLDPTQAYAAGAFDQALQSLADAQVERPEDPALMMNMGSVHYKMQPLESYSRLFTLLAVQRWLTRLQTFK